MRLVGTAGAPTASDSAGGQRPGHGELYPGQRRRQRQRHHQLHRDGCARWRRLHPNAPGDIVRGVWLEQRHGLHLHGGGDRTGSIPTLSAWGLVLMSGLLALQALVVLRRKLPVVDSYV